MAGSMASCQPGNSAPAAAPTAAPTPVPTPAPTCIGCENLQGRMEFKGFSVSTFVGVYRLAFKKTLAAQLGVSLNKIILQVQSSGRRLLAMYEMAMDDDISPIVVDDDIPPAVSRRLARPRKEVPALRLADASLLLRDGESPGRAAGGRGPGS